MKNFTDLTDITIPPSSIKLPRWFDLEGLEILLKGDCSDEEPEEG